MKTTCIYVHVFGKWVSISANVRDHYLLEKDALSCLLSLNETKELYLLLKSKIRKLVKYLISCDKNDCITERK